MGRRGEVGIESVRVQEFMYGRGNGEEERSNTTEEEALHVKLTRFSLISNTLHIQIAPKACVHILRSSSVCVLCKILCFYRGTADGITGH